MLGMAEKPKQLNLEQLKEEKPEEAEALRPLTREEFSGLLKLGDYRDFVKRIKAFEGEARERGVDLTEALRYLETGEGNSSAVRSAFLELRNKETDIDIEKVKKEKLFGSDKELGEFLEKTTKWGKFLEDFDFFMELPRQLEKGDQITKRDEEPEPINKKEYLDFAKKLKSIEKEIRDIGIDFDGVVKLLMGGKGDSLSSVEIIIELIIASEMEKFRQAAERRGNPYSDEELVEIGCKTTSYKLLVELKMLRKLEKTKRELAKQENNETVEEIAELVARRMSATTRGRMEEMGGGPIDTEFSPKTEVKKARREFQMKMQSIIRNVLNMERWLKEDEERGEGKSVNILKSMEDYKRSLEGTAERMANEFKVDKKEIYRSEADHKIYLTKEYLEERPAVPNLEQPNREGRIKKAREQFQITLWDTLRIAADLYKSLSKESTAGEETSKNLESFKFYKQILEAQANDMAKWFQIKPEDIFVWKSNPEKYLSKEYIKDGPEAGAEKTKEGFSEEDLKGLAKDLGRFGETIQKKNVLGKQELGIRDIKVREAKEQFQDEMRYFLEKRNIFWAEISKLGTSEQDEEQKDKRIQEITKIDEQLIARATELTEEEKYKKYVITWKEVFDPEEPPDLPGLEKNVGGPEQEILPAARKAFLELRDSVKEIILEKTGLFDEVGRASTEVLSCADLLKMENLSPAEKREYEEKIQTNNRKIKEAEIRIKEIDDRIEGERERITQKYGIDKSEIEFNFHLGNFGREPYSSV